MDKKLILVSKSPRRHELLSQIGVPFKAIKMDFDEPVNAALSPKQNVNQIALHKAQAAAKQFPNQTILTADTMVVINGQMLGKPKNLEDAKRMLRLLSGTTHQVLTAICLMDSHGKTHQALSTSNVRFKLLSETEIADYCQSKEPFDKAGAYAIQGLAAQFIEHIDGSYSGIMGLPLFETAQLLSGSVNGTTVRVNF